MGLVNLRGREAEPKVRALLAFAHGSPESVERAVDSYRDGSWFLAGWEEDGDVLACAGVSRDERRDVVLHSVAVVPERRGRGIGRSLLDGLAEVANARRLVAETDADTVRFYERCGFTAEEVRSKGGRKRFRCVRTLDVEPAPPGAAAAVTLAELERAIRASWGRETSDDPDEWTDDNPARGQCCATALLVRDLLGGDILIANVLSAGERIERHAWNRLPSGLTVDLSRSQYTNGEQFQEPRVGEPIHHDRCRYELLAARVNALLAAD